MNEPVRRWHVHVAVGAVVLAAALLALVGTVWWAVSLALPCVPDFSESTIVAPDSYRGRLLCSVSDGELGTSGIAVGLLAALPAVALVVAVAAWVRRRRWTPVLVGCLAAVALPWGVNLALRAVPADCTDAQWAAHGAVGCERNEEKRPGLGQYGG